MPKRDKRGNIEVLDFVGKYAEIFNRIDGSYKFRNNIVTGKIEFITIELKGRKYVTTSDWEEVDDTVLAEIMSFIYKGGSTIPSNVLKGHLMTREVAYKYDPFNEYFAMQEPWGGQVDYIRQLAKTVTVAKEDEDIFYTSLKRYLIGTVDGLLNEGKSNDTCLVLQGDQGSGKSRWFRRLLPKQFRSKYYYEGEIDTSKKDHDEYLSMFWLINFDELETLNNNKLGSLKSYMTKALIHHRKAWGIFNTRFIRRASFCGSVNKDKFLKDTTGNRRWIVFSALDVDYEHKINMDNVWSQAHSLLLSGEKGWLNKEEIAELDLRNEMFREQSEEELMFWKCFEPVELGQSDGEWLYAIDMKERMCNYYYKMASGLDTRRLGRVAKKHALKDCIRPNKSKGNKYYIKYIGVTELNETSNKAVGNTKAAESDDDLPF